MDKGVQPEVILVGGLGMGRFTRWLLQKGGIKHVQLAELVAPIPALPQPSPPISPAQPTRAWRQLAAVSMAALRFRYEPIPAQGATLLCGFLAKCLHCVRTACILRTQRLGYSPKNTCHLFTRGKTERCQYHRVGPVSIDTFGCSYNQQHRRRRTVRPWCRLATIDYRRLRAFER